MDRLSELWAKTLSVYSQSAATDKVLFESIIALCKARKQTHDELIVTAESEFTLPTIEEAVPELERIFNELSGAHIHITLMSEDAYNESRVKPEEKIQFEDHLNPDFTFNNFVVGSSNRIAQNASLAVATKPGNTYSPLFIYSNSGLGKTHLLNAIGNYIKSKRPGMKVLYSTSEEFVNEYVSAIANHTINDFNYLYRNVDVLLIDDIQFIASKDSSMEMFFNIFNTLYNANKQIVITSDKNPRDLKGMENRLVSRFTNGLMVSIDTPEFETAKAILQKKLETEHVNYPIHEEVIDMMASRFNRDVRELEGSLKRLLFYKLVFGAEKDDIDLEFALEAFEDDQMYSNEGTRDNLSVDEIKRCVASYYNLSVAQINSKSRTSNIIVARHIAMYLVRNLIDNISYIQIGREFGGRDHSTVMKACDKVEKKLEKGCQLPQGH